MKNKKETKHLSRSGWDDLNYWTTGEWQVIQERLDDLDKQKIIYNPERHLMFAALDTTPFSEVKVMILGQDPYPNHDHATGIAFSIPKEIKKEQYPPTLKIIFEELWKDLKIKPLNGSLVKWAKSGVLLWNVFPTCLWGKPGSHDWVEYHYLTKEIIEKLNSRGIVFVFLGAVAREDYLKYVDFERNRVVVASHPSPLGARRGFNAFVGSRLFSTINIKLNELDKLPIDWRL